MKKVGTNPAMLILLSSPTGNHGHSDTHCIHSVVFARKPVTLSRDRLLMPVSNSQHFRHIRFKVYIIPDVVYV